MNYYRTPSQEIASSVFPTHHSKKVTGASHIAYINTYSNPPLTLNLERNERLYVPLEV